MSLVPMPRVPIPVPPAPCVVVPLVRDPLASIRKSRVIEVAALGCTPASISACLTSVMFDSISVGWLSAESERLSAVAIRCCDSAFKFAFDKWVERSLAN